MADPIRPSIICSRATRRLMLTRAHFQRRDCKLRQEPAQTGFRMTGRWALGGSTLGFELPRPGVSRPRRDSAVGAPGSSLREVGFALAQQWLGPPDPRL